MPIPPRRAGKTSGRSGGAPDMMARATAQASRDASALFAHLEDYAEPASLESIQTEKERAALTLSGSSRLTRPEERARGEWARR